MEFEGIHHITAITSDGQSNVDFYAGVLGFRLVKKTVNFDDPGTYHLYYGDAVGSPGTILTFFPFADGIEAAAKYGIQAVVQPGGSVRDEEVIEAVDNLGLVMVFTGARHFRH